MCANGLCWIRCFWHLTYKISAKHNILFERLTKTLHLEKFREGFNPAGGTSFFRSLGVFAISTQLGRNIFSKVTLAVILYPSVRLTEDPAVNATFFKNCINRCAKRL